MSATLPDIIATYFEAVNAGDAKAASAVFTPFGSVSDERQIHQGREAVQIWCQDTIVRYRMQADVLSLADIGDHKVAVVRVSGTFPGSPLDFTYRFTLSDQGIEQLHITL